MVSKPHIPSGLAGASSGRQVGLGGKREANVGRVVCGCRGMTSPFIRKAAVNYTPPKRAVLEEGRVGLVRGWCLK